MKHLEIQPENRTQAPQPKNSSMSISKLALIAGLLITGVGYSISAWWSPLPADHLTEKEKAELVTGFTQLRTISVEKIKDQDIDLALDKMRLDPSSRQALKQTLDKNTSRSPSTILVKVTVWDFASQDGDVVRLSSSGYSIDVALLNEPVVFTLPVDASQTIQLTGVHDGGGGITLGVQNGTGKVLLPVISEGQAITLPVNF